MDPDILGPDAYREIARFRRALDLTEGFAFHLIVAGSKPLLDAAVDELDRDLQKVRPRTQGERVAEEAATGILAELDQALSAAEGRPLLVDVMAVTPGDNIWTLVFRQLNSLRNGLERRHRGPFILALTPAGERLLGQEAPDLWSKRGSGMRLVPVQTVPRPKVLSAAAPLPPPTSPAEFESLCLELFGDIWHDPGAQKNGRSGQPQAGVDVFGRFEGRWMGVVCIPLRDDLRSRDVAERVESARRFRPPLAELNFAVAGPRDVELQQYARKISDPDLVVRIWFWRDLWEELYRRPKLLGRIWQVYWPSLPKVGPIPQKLAPSRLGHVADRLFGRDSYLAELAAAWEDLRIHIVTLVAWGGVGKTSLVAQFAGQLAARDFDGADYFDWSFYSQGTRPGGVATADSFIDAALRFFGDEPLADSPENAWDKGARLAALLGARRALLILDGLEPLQHPPGPLAGELKDPALKSLLRGLAQRNAGLCLVTSREQVVDLERWERSTAPRWELEQLSVSAGVALLRSLGVDGSAADLTEAVREAAGHALTLNLLGRFLQRAHGGDVRKRDRVDFSGMRKERGGRHAFQVMEAYEKWLESGASGARLLAVLRLLGLFDRMASDRLLGVLRAAPAIAELTEPLQGLGEPEWNLAVGELEAAGLVTREDGGIDAHPLVREYFAHGLQGGRAWREAHGRLFDHLKHTTEYRPDGLAALQPLYQAVYHGCQAGRFQEACDEVYLARILRGTGPGGFYSTRQLGAIGADLAAVACFFEQPWSRVAPALSEAAQAWLLNEVAFHLRALGRLREAVEPMRAGLDEVARLKNWSNAAHYACNLSELALLLGEVPAAVADAEQSVAFADRSGDDFEQAARRTTLADALHQAGEKGAALALFQIAERLFAKRLPKDPVLVSLEGFQYCDLLLAEAERAAGNGSPADLPGRRQECDEVERRATRMLGMAAEDLLDIALGHLMLGRARLYRAILCGRTSPPPVDAREAVEKAVVALRAAGMLDYLPRGLLTRSWLRFVDGDPAGAQADLDEAEEIAERGSMRLHLADVALYRARFFGDQDALAAAKRLVAECGYGRRREEIADLEERLERSP